VVYLEKKRMWCELYYSLFFIVENLASTKNKNISLYVNENKPHLINQFYNIELGIKFIS